MRYIQGDFGAQKWVPNSVLKCRKVDVQRLPRGSETHKLKFVGAGVS